MNLFPNSLSPKKVNNGSTTTGDVVVAMDCTQDKAIISAGQSRELINAIQQLRKAMGLDLSDKVEVLFEENAGMTAVEDAVSMNVNVFEAKFQGAVPVPKKFARSRVSSFALTPRKLVVLG